MKLIFLSTDGVLCNEIHLERISRRGAKYMYDTYNQIDKDKVSLINLLVNKTSARVVYFGNWKNIHSTEKLNSMLKRAGATWEADDSVDYMYKSQNGKFATNLDEIDSYINNIYAKACNIDNFVILDDKSTWGKYDKNLVKVTYDKGLKPSHIERALEIMGNGKRKSVTNT